MSTRELERNPEMGALRTYYARVGRPEPARLDAVRRRVLTRLASPGAARPRSARRGANPTRRWLLPATATGLLTVTSLTLALVLLPGTSHRDGGGVAALPDDLAAPATLELVANRTANAPALTVTGAKYVYTTTTVRSLAKAPVGKEIAWYQSDSTISSWVSATDAAVARLVVTSGRNARPLTASDAAALKRSSYPWQATQTRTYQGGSAGKPGPVHPTPAYLASLPLDPGKLLAAIRGALPESKPGSSEQQTFDAVCTLAERADALLGPHLRAALYKALAQLPGIERVPGQTDLAGRKGVAIGRSDGRTRSDLILDPTTSRVIGTRQVLLVQDPKGALKPGTVVTWSTTDQRIVASVDATS
jgi:hypothetical protein